MRKHLGIAASLAAAISFGASGANAAGKSPLVLRSGTINLSETFDVFRLDIHLAGSGFDKNGFQVHRCIDGGIANHIGDAR